MKQILNIEVDKELDMTEVVMRVPEFQNFCQHLGELQRKSAEALAATPPDLEEISTVMAKLNAMTEGALKAMPDGPQKEMILKMMKETDETEAADEQEMEPEEETEEFQHDLQQLRVSIPAGLKWDTGAEAKVDQFLADWPKVRPDVLKATANY